MLFQTNRTDNSAENSVDFASKIYDVKPIQSAWNFLVEFYSQKSFKPAVILLYSALALTLGNTFLQRLRLPIPRQAPTFSP